MQEAARLHRAADGNDENGEEHHDALDEVRPRDGEKAADQRVEHDRASAEENGIGVGHAEDRFKKTPGRDKARRRVDDKEDQDENGRHDAQEVGAVKVAILQKLGKRQRVIGKLRVAAKTRSDEVPVSPGAKSDADCYPAGIQPCEIGKARHAHQHPAAHVGGFCRKRGNPCAELAVAEEVIAHVACAAVVINANRHHDADVKDEGIDDSKIMCHKGSPGGTQTTFHA